VRADLQIDVPHASFPYRRVFRNVRTQNMTQNPKTGTKRGTIEPFSVVLPQRLAGRCGLPHGRERTARSYRAADHHARRGRRCCLRLHTEQTHRRATVARRWGSWVVASAIEAIRSFAGRTVSDLVVGGELHEAAKKGDLAAVKARLRSRTTIVLRP
jgi:hypothetical protein